MKKTALLIFTITLFTIATKAQLTNSKWRGTLNIPEPAECIFEFKKDTLNLYVVANNSLLETMSYRISKDSIMLIKLSGQSPCTGETKGSYRFSIKEDKLFITPLADDCSERLNAFTAEAWIRERE